MSWDFYLALPVKADGGMVALSGYDNLGYTYNVAEMYVEAFSQDLGIRCLHNRRCKDVLPWIDAAIKLMKADPAKYRRMNPPNGWGDYQGALEVLEKLAEWCREVPTGVIIVS